ncbi:hypothetical protein [Marinobacter sp. ANT_B65]|uniref:hypothetical protein n=1 Tax=Marinobacter sp. ANT_B65 TaxID=2039467 RepID=UPI000BBE3DDE|nr:hypothetical protein [Marinobacter sp. ANT_B65]PCM43770.1 hypothetical protein CPA50_15560 [Marinobacter sp. ANT_B65]
MTFRSFLELFSIDFDQLAMGQDGGSFVLTEMEIAPLDFLMQAESDLSTGGASALLNSVTNAKRAITCQADQLLLSFGYPAYSWNIPRKLEKLQELGLLTPAILRKVSKVRNLLEHEYIKPTQCEVKESLDIATLFVMANVALFHPFGDGLEGGVSESWNEKSKTYAKRVCFGLNTDRGEVAYRAVAREDDCHLGSYLIRNKDPMFAALVRLAVSFELRYKTDEAFQHINNVYKSS